ncbi:hypothetical protein [Latilactobacillus sakei]|uniref:hypothetical protein n=1 Tax=Latilactobacillus sakei TaxID=1599 RepID=UPI002030104E|nr:hypothetical protein [Latilactobacillus sakei]MCM1635818.1 hypothetical protein [Latilactobacillus sakei]
MMNKITKRLGATFFVLSTILILTACMKTPSVSTVSGTNKNTTTTTDTTKENAVAKRVQLGNNNPKNNPNYVDIGVGRPIYAAGIVSIPIAVKNTGTNTTQFNQDRFSLVIGSSRYNFFHKSGMADDFQIRLEPGDVWESVLSFSTKGNLNQAKINQAKVELKTSSGKVVNGGFIPNNMDWSTSEPRMVNHDFESIASFYVDQNKFVEQRDDPDKSKTKQSEEEITQVPNPEKFAFRMKPVLTKSGDKSTKLIFLTITNGTGQNMLLKLSDMQLTDTKNLDTTVDDYLQHFSVFVPGGKSVNTLMKLTDSISLSNAPYKVAFNTNGGDHYMFTDKSTSPIGLSFIHAVKEEDLFTLTPDAVQASGNQISANIDETLKGIKVSYNLNKSNGMKYNTSGFELTYSESDDTPKRTVRLSESAGKDFTVKPGMGGYFTIPFDYYKDLKSFKLRELKYKGRFICNID